MRRIQWLVLVGVTLASLLGSLVLPQPAAAQPGTSAQGSLRLKKLTWLEQYHTSRLAYILDQMDAEGLSILGDTAAQGMAKLQSVPNPANTPDTISPGGGVEMVQIYYEMQKSSSRERVAELKRERDLTLERIVRLQEFVRAELAMRRGRSTAARRRAAQERAQWSQDMWAYVFSWWERQQRAVREVIWTVPSDCQGPGCYGSGDDGGGDDGGGDDGGGGGG